MGGASETAYLLMKVGQILQAPLDRRLKHRSGASVEEFGEHLNIIVFNWTWSTPWQKLSLNRLSAPVKN